MQLSIHDLWIPLVMAIVLAWPVLESRLPPPLQPSPSQIEVLWMAPFLSGGGYSSEAMTYVMALRSLVTLRIGQHGDSIHYPFLHGLPEDTQLAVDEMMHTSIHLNQTIVICHSEPGAWYPPHYQTSRCPPAKTGYTIGRTMFESDRLPDKWHERCNEMDEIWVPGRFHLATFAAGGVDPNKLYSIPEAVDSHFFDPETTTPLPLPLSDEYSFFKFLSIFKWEKRKGWDVLLTAYFEEFTAKDPVALILLTKPYHQDISIESAIEAFAKEKGLGSDLASLPEVLVLNELAQPLMPSLYKAADAFVLPSRGEGWGRPHMEAMAMGLPVIATNWSGNTEFMHPSNSFLIPIEPDLVDMDNPAFPGHRWALPSVPGLRKLMREVYENREQARARGQQARRDMVQHYSPDHVARVIVGHLSRIAHTMKQRRGQRQGQ